MRQRRKLRVMVSCSGCVFFDVHQKPVKTSSLKTLQAYYLHCIMQKPILKINWISIFVCLLVFTSKTADQSHEIQGSQCLVKLLESQTNQFFITTTVLPHIDLYYMVIKKQNLDLQKLTVTKLNLNTNDYHPRLARYVTRSQK